MIIGVITNAEKDTDYRYTKQVCDFLTARNVEFFLDKYTKADFWAVLGGDGTMLRASHYAAALGVPMLGINLGTLGYLTAADMSDGIDAITDVLNGNYVKESRLMLEIETDGAGSARNGRIALNDVHLTRGLGRLTAFRLFINGLFIDELRADGVIVATPTGSTAYNLSAGGPILMPDGDMMVVTAVCPHTLHVRPWVISSRDEIRVCPSVNDAVCALDGEEGFILRAGESLTVRASSYRAEIIKKKTSPHFYEILRKKLR